MNIQGLRHPILTLNGRHFIFLEPAKDVPPSLHPMSMIDELDALDIWAQIEIIDDSSRKRCAGNPKVNSLVLSFVER